ncbi:uncharacterized protein LOC131383569 [Hylobates moloch]|uniref:uncharacterized protein LOC131383569 n=1 Tax=Hylobates moloch TaxID=81572 RepID=UPI0026746EE3|nr:uncharacterized protein LOC131383569 [Hylobates moloch]
MDPVPALVVVVVVSGVVKKPKVTRAGAHRGCLRLLPWDGGEGRLLLAWHARACALETLEPGRARPGAPPPGPPRARARAPLPRAAAVAAAARPSGGRARPRDASRALSARLTSSAAGRARLLVLTRRLGWRRLRRRHALVERRRRGRLRRRGAVSPGLSEKSRRKRPSRNEIYGGGILEQKVRMRRWSKTASTRLPSPSTLGSSKEAVSDVNLCSHGNAEPWGGSRGGAGARRKTGPVDASVFLILLTALQLALDMVNLRKVKLSKVGWLTQSKGRLQGLLFTTSCPFPYS